MKSITNNNAEFKSPYFTIEEVAEQLNVSKATINVYVKDGILAKRKIGKRVLFRQEDIDAAIIKLEEKHGLTDAITQDDPSRMSIAEVADYLKISVATVKSYITREILTKYQDIKGTYLKINEVEAAIEQQLNKPTQEASSPAIDLTVYIPVDEAARQLSISPAAINFFSQIGLLNKYPVTKTKKMLKIEEVNKFTSRLNLLKTA